MHRYEVIRPWNGVKKGQVLELRGEIADALRTNVREVVAERAASGSDAAGLTAEQVEEVLQQARIAAASIVDEARDAAHGIVADAREDAARIVQAAEQAADQIRTSAQAGQPPAGTLTPSTPGGVAGGSSAKDRKVLIVGRLEALKIDHDARKGVDTLAALLPPDELKALSPTE